MYTFSPRLGKIHLQYFTTSSISLCIIIIITDNYQSRDYITSTQHPGTTASETRACSFWWTVCLWMSVSLPWDWPRTLSLLRVVWRCWAPSFKTNPPWCNTSISGLVMLFREFFYIHLYFILTLWCNISISRLI